MRAVTSDLAAFLEARRTASDVQMLVADCFTFTLRSGMVLTYTNADLSILLNGFIYAANAVLVDGLRYNSSVGLDVDQQKITLAARASDTIGGMAFLVALQAGAFDGCLVRRDRAFLAAWGQPPVGAVTLFQGRVTTIDEIGRTSAEITVASDLVLLDVQMPRNIYQPTCNHTLYDSGCALVKNAFGANGVVGAGVTAGSIPWAGAADLYTQGTLVFTSGVGLGVTASIKGGQRRCACPCRAASRGAGGRRHVHRLPGLRSYRCDMSGQVRQSRALSWLSVRACSGDGVLMNQDTQQRQVVVAEARRWIGTRYHPGADVRGAGVDCGMLIVRIFVDLGLCPAFDPRPYPQDWHLHRADERYLGFVTTHCGEVAAASPGDICVFRFGRCYAHGGIVTSTSPLTLVHAFSPAGCVLEEAVAANSTLSGSVRRPRFFSLWANDAEPIA